MAKKMATVQIVRRVVLGITLVGLSILMYLHQKMQGIPSIDALDPFGGVETLLKFIAGGELIKRIEPGTMVLFAGVMVLGVVMSRFFCGWLCAFGALQGVFGWLGQKIFRKRYTVPAKLDRVLRWVKYPLLVGIVYFTWRTGTLVIRPYDPVAVFGHASAGFAEIWAEFAVGFVILVATIVLSMLYDRVFCKYLCPLGALNAILGRIPLFRIKRVASTCISCSKCDKVCPMNIDVSHPEAVNSSECISCMECVTTCPTKKTSLVTTLGGKTLKLGTAVAIGLAIYLGAAGIGQLAGARYVAPSLKDLAEKGGLKVEDIKGSSTWAQVADSFGIEHERLYREAGVDPRKVPGDTKLKDTGALLGGIEFEADVVRIAVAKIIGVPYAGEGVKPAEAVPAVPAATPAAPAATPAAATATTVAKPAAAPAPTSAAAPAAKAGDSLVVPPDFVLEGTMTIADVAKALKASNAAVAKKLGLPADIAVDKPLRDMKDQYGYTMPGLKELIKK